VSSLDRILPFLRPIEDLLRDPAITEVMVNDGGRRVFVEREGALEAVPDRTLEPRNLTVAIKNIARACGDEISDVQPLLDAVVAYLPVRASQAGADIGLYFAADGLAIFLMRLPTGWLTDRITTRTLVTTGATATAVAIAMLLLPLTTPLMIVSGLIGGAGGAIVMTPILVELSRRSTDADRGSAFALFSGGLATAMTLGSIGGAPIVAMFGLSAALAVGIALIGASIALTLADASLRSKGPGARPGPEMAVATA